MKSITALLVFGSLLLAAPVATTSVASTPRSPESPVATEDHDASRAELFARLRAYYDLENKIELRVLQAGQAQALKRFAGMTLGDFSSLDESLEKLAKELGVTIGTYEPSTAADQQQLQALKDAAAKLDMLSGKALDEAYLKFAKEFHNDVLTAVEAAAAGETDEKVKALLEDFKTKETTHLEQLATLQTQADDGSLDQGGASASGSGNGNGNGDGHSNGNGNGNGNKSGDNGNGNGNGAGTGNGNGNGNGNSDNNASTCSNSCTCTCGAQPSGFDLAR